MTDPAEAERLRIAEEIRGFIPPSWPTSAENRAYWRAWWDVADAVECNFDPDVHSAATPKETPADA